MPKIVDHDERRLELLEAVKRLIARVGLEEASNRAIAAETGWSTGTLAHYFSDKTDLIHKTLMHVHQAQVARLPEIGDVADRDLVRALIVLGLPLDRSRREEAVVEVTFWPRAIHDPELGELQQSDFSLWLQFVADALASCEPQALALEPEAAAEIVVAFIDGLQLEAVLHPRHFTKSRINRMVDNVLDLVFVDN